MPNRKGLPPALGAWNAHLAEYRRNHPNLSLKQCMQGASKTYRSSRGGSHRRKGGFSFFNPVKFLADKTMGLGVDALFKGPALLAKKISGGRRKRPRKGGVIAPTDMWGNIIPRSRQNPDILY